MGRFTPALPVEAMKTYSLRAPLETHWRDATCAEVDCRHFLHGWMSPIDESTEWGQQQAYYIRHQSGRRFTEHRSEACTVFVFEAGQRCFISHKRSLERDDPLLIVRLGDWRGYGPGRAHSRADDWIEDMQETLDRVRTRQERG